MFTGLVLWAYSAKGDLDHDELLFFLTGGVGLQNTLPNPTDKTWLSDRSWDEICRISALPSFKGFAYVSSSTLSYSHEKRMSVESREAWSVNLTVKMGCSVTYNS